MREDLDCLAAEHNRGHAVAAVRGHDDEVAVFRPSGGFMRRVGCYDQVVT